MIAILKLIFELYQISNLLTLNPIHPFQYLLNAGELNKCAKSKKERKLVKYKCTSIKTFLFFRAFFAWVCSDCISKRRIKWNYVSIALYLSRCVYLSLCYSTTCDNNTSLTKYDCFYPLFFHSFGLFHLENVMQRHEQQVWNSFSKRCCCSIVNLHYIASQFLFTTQHNKKVEINASVNWTNRFKCFLLSQTKHNIHNTYGIKWSEGFSPFLRKINFNFSLTTVYFNGKYYARCIF